MSVGPATRKLLELSSPALSPGGTGIDLEACMQLGGVPMELAGILGEKNGFHAFESALHFFPSNDSPSSVGLDDWNSDSGWRSEFGELADGCLFFAEDVFGGQFCLKDGRVWQFDPETGELTLLGESLEEWAAAVLGDFAFLTGHPVAREWQLLHGPLPAKMRLVPKVPFVLGGPFSVSNLSPMDSERAMRVRGNLARQISNLPDGEKIRLVTGEGL